MLELIHFSIQITEHTIEKHGAQLGTVVADNIRKRLNSDLNSSAVSTDDADILNIILELKAMVCLHDNNHALLNVLTRYSFDCRLCSRIQRTLKVFVLVLRA